MKTPSSVQGNSLSSRAKGWLIIVISLSAFLLALALRLWHVNELQFQFDEWLGGWHINPALNWGGSLVSFANDLWGNVRDYVASGQTVFWSCLVELTQLVTGPSVVSVRVLAAFGGAVGAGVVALIGWRVFHRNLIATLSAVMVSVFSVTGIIFGQFADVYASAIFASSLQLSVYFLWTRRKETAGGWLIFSGSAFVSQLLMYTQLWLTAGIFLAGLWEALLQSSRRRSVRRLFPAAVVYGILSVLHLSVMLKVIPWSESFRWYMAAYYPIFWKETGQAAGFIRVVAYFLWRLYDLFNYHLSLVFNPRVYQPLQWNWVSLPFLAVLVAGILCRIMWGRREVRGKQYDADSIPRLLITTLLICLLANSFSLIPFGGVRQMFFILPLLALFYGWLVYAISSRIKMPGRVGPRSVTAVILATFLMLIPILPLSLSFPAIYIDRISRLDLDALSEALDRYRPRALVASGQNIQILEMALNRDPRFSGVYWPGYEHPSDALDADFSTSFPVMRFGYGEREWTVHWIRKDYFPETPDSLLWIDMHISRDSRFEGRRMRRFYPVPDEVVPGGYRIIPLKEIPGNAPAALHQSIYWPPNSFYLYLIRKEQ